jgi:putative ABC transport system substrate-binding protein
LSGSSASFTVTWRESFQQGLRELGYVEGKSISVEYRHAEGQFDRLPDLAAELVQLKVDLIIASGDSAILAAQQATKTIPIVFVAASDPVGDRFVTSLAKPGGNATGLSNLNPELSAKRLELFKEAFPKISRLGVLSGPRSVLYTKEQELAAQSLGIQLISLVVRKPDDVEAVFATVKKENVHALLTNTSYIINAARQRILEFTLKNRLPAMYPNPEFVDAGGLMSYGPSFTDMFRRAATYVDKILKCAKPADLPVEQPEKFELVINLKTAKQIDLTIPPNVLARADKVIR